MVGGVYTLVIRVRRPSEMPVGRLGVLPFRRGYYLYTGSALGGLYWRLKRHLSRAKRLRWHIDYLLSSRDARVDAVIHASTKRRMECPLNQRLGKVFRIRSTVERFGSSDCSSGCGSHLLFLGDRGLPGIVEGVRESYSSLGLVPVEHHEKAGEWNTC
jgi:Uri superfamily endonuclease